MARKGRVFLCHNSREKDLVKPIALDLLSSSGLRTWLDTWEIPGGVKWEQHIRRAFAASSSSLVFVGSFGFGTYQRQEIGWAKERQAIDPDYRVIPVLLPDVHEHDLEELDRLLPQVHWVDLRRSEAREYGPSIANALRGDGPGPPVQALTVAVAAERWDQTGRTDKSLLVRGGTLREAQRLAKDDDTFDELSLSFLAASAEAQQRRVRRGLAVLASTAIALTVLALYANRKRIDAVTAAEGERRAREAETLQRQAAERASDRERTQRQLAEDQKRLADERAALARSQAIAADARRGAVQELNLALASAVEAFEISPSVDAQAALLETLGRARHIRQFFLCAAGEKATGVAFSAGAHARLAFSCYARTTRIVVVDPDGTQHAPITLDGDARTFRFLDAETLAVGPQRDLRLVSIGTGRVQRRVGYSADSSMASRDSTNRDVDGTAETRASACETQYPPSRRYMARAASADGKRAVYTTEANELIVDDRSGTCGPVLAGHTHNVLALAVRDDGYEIASAGAVANADDTHGVILWDLQQTHPLARLVKSTVPGYVAEGGVALSADGTSWAAALSGTVWWNGRQVMPPKSLANGTFALVALSPNGAELGLSARDGPIVRVKRSSAGLAWQSLRTPLSTVVGLWYAASDLLARGADGAIVRMPPSGESETVQQGSPDDSWCADLSTTGPSLAFEIGNGRTAREIRIRYFDSRPPRALRVPAASGGCLTVAMDDSSGTAIRSSVEYEPLYVVDAKDLVTPWDNPVRAPSGLRTRLSQLRLSSGGTRAVANSNGDALVVLDVPSRRLVGTIDIPQLGSIAVSRDGMTALTFGGAGLQRWDLDPKTWAETARRMSGRSRPANARSAG